jgi:hypothetical protein
MNALANSMQKTALQAGRRFASAAAHVPKPGVPVSGAMHLRVSVSAHPSRTQYFHTNASSLSYIFPYRKCTSTPSERHSCRILALTH